MCEFCPLSITEKKEFVDYYVDNFIDKIRKDNSLTLNISKEEIKEIKNIDVQEIENIRDIKRILSKRVLGYLE